MEFHVLVHESKFSYSTLLSSLLVTSRLKVKSVLIVQKNGNAVKKK